MDFLRNSIAALLAASLAACATANSGGALVDANAACSRGASHAEVHLTGYVARVLGVRGGESGSHEGFILNSSGTQLKIEDNVDITGYIPLRRGDAVELQGQYECNDGVIHWTHRDPRGRHLTGFVKVHGRIYQ